MSGAQRTIEMKGKVMDAEKQIPLEDAMIKVEGYPGQAFSDKNGLFTFSLNKVMVDEEITIYCQRYPYTGISRVVRITGNIEGLFEVFEMVAEVNELPQVSINGAPDVVWGSEEINVADFVFWKEKILLLTYDHEQRWKKQEEQKITLYDEGRLILIGADGKELSRLYIQGLVIGFYQNLMGDTFLKCRDKIYNVTIVEDEIFVEPTSADFFDNNVLPLVDSFESKLYLTNFRDDYPAMDYVAYDQKDSSDKLIRHIEDELTMQLMRSEFKYLPPHEKMLAYQVELDTGVDKEIVAAYMSGFQYTQYFDEINAPLFVCNDTLHLFDHHHAILYRYTTDGSPIDSFNFEYHKTSRPEKWDEKLILDEVEQKIYTTTSTQGGSTFIKQINLDSGEVLRSMKLSYSFATNVKVRNGLVYYIYRPFGSLQNRFLYSEIVR
jgi:hypothetical protein